MSEKEKMINEQVYDSADDTLLMEREQAKDICFAFNAITPSNRPKRLELIRSLLGCSDESTWIESDFYCDYGYNIKVGKHFYANHHCIMLDSAPIIIGDHVLLAPNVGLYTPSHPLDAIERSSGVESAKSIHIHDNVWIGAGVSILGGVTIGENTIIGAGSVVTKDIPANVVAVGNPCNILKENPMKK